MAIAGLINSCNSVKRVAEDEHLLTDNNVYVNGDKNNTELIDNLLYQHPNRKIFGIPLRLYIYNSARPNIDSIINAGIDKNPKKRERLEKRLSKKQLDKYVESRNNFNEWLKETGEAPTIVDGERTEKSVKRLKDYYFHNGWFNVDASYNIVEVDTQKAQVNYNVKTGKGFIIDSITTKIATPAIDSLYQKTKEESLIKKGEQYKTLNFENERNRITNNLRNSGVYHFSQDYLGFEIDTVGTNKKVNVDLQIKNRALRTQDSVVRRPFNIYKVKEVNIFTDSSYENKDETATNTNTFNGYDFYSVGEMRYKPKAITDAVFINPGEVFKDSDRTLTYRHISELKTFKYPNIEYIENPDTTLTANIFLTPLKKFSLGFAAEVSQSNIQTIGFSVNPSILMRNVFSGAETLELSAFGSVGASKDAGNDKDQFFDITEAGLDLKLTIPRLLLPFNTERVIPKYMFPSTRMSVSYTGQRNIGLDKQTLNGVLNYRWRPSNFWTNRLDLFNVQYVRNLNPDNYFGVYKNSYNTLNNISQDVNYNNGDDLTFPDQTDAFIDDVLNGNTSISPGDTEYQTVSDINEREQRLTENNLIFASNFSFVKDNRTNLFDESFSIFRFKLEFAGNLLSNVSKIIGIDKNEEGKYEIFNVAYSQYAKTEFDYIKHWDLSKKNVFAIRAFLGIAIPYGNSTNIPFSKSFFAGGANDNRAWTAYNLGPGSTASTNEFNEANLKLAFSLEQRFNIFENLNGALFVDTGNIWNVFDDVEDPNATFDSLSSLKDIAIGSGFGLRYDFGFFVFRFDVGFKTYNPAYNENNRWFNDYNFRNAVYNIGINYPF
ncbi:MAG TPA: BamA/TamA family outer membrane protein [Flavobacteriaceae bacterium]|nr:BamA/TamA family outer membrane protein [Flavobacteriaceae bacterium]